jgi:hypothetical protein
LPDRFVHALGGRCRGLGPGDQLTLRLTVHPDLQGPAIDLLAARSLIYNRIVLHGEMLPDDDPCPHARDEIDASRLVAQLEYEDCRELYRQVKALPRPEARSLVQGYVARQGIAHTPATPSQVPLVPAPVPVPVRILKKTLAEAFWFKSDETVRKRFWTPWNGNGEGNETKASTH